jgi:hypothetical protein
VAASDRLPSDVFVVLVALAALCGWLMVRALRNGRMDLSSRFAIDRGRQPLRYWGAIAFCAVVPIVYLAYILTAY